MRLLCITSLLSACALTGCNLYGVIRSETPPIVAADLAVKHTYKVPAKKSKNHLSRFNDAQLQQLVAVALTDSPNMQSAAARIVRARHIAKGAYAVLWPSADLRGSYSQQHFSFQGTVPPPINELVFSKLGFGNLGINFNYEFDFWGKNRQIFASRLNETFAAEMDMRQTQLILSASVASAYFELQNSLIQLRLAKDNVRLLKELEDIVLDRAKQGIQSDIPLKSAISNTQTARLSIDEYKRAALQARHQLAVLLGKNPFNTHIETTQFSYNKKQLTLPKVISINVLAQRPDIASARALMEAQAHQINVARAAFLPNINLSGILSLQSLYFSKLFNVRIQTESVRPAIELPLFDAGARRANLGVRHAEFELSVNRYNQSILNALKEVSDYMTAVQTLNRQVDNQTLAVNTINSNYTLFKARYKQGIIDYVQLIEIQQTLLQQKAMLYNLQARQKQAFVALLAALGGGVSYDTK